MEINVVFLEPTQAVSLKCPANSHYNCEPEIEDFYEAARPYYPPYDDNVEPKSNYSNTFFIMALVPMFFILIVCAILVVFLAIRKGKKKYLYGTSRSFSNPNYYSANGAVNVLPNNGKAISKRLKYNKSQVRKK